MLSRTRTLVNALPRSTVISTTTRSFSSSGSVSLPPRSNSPSTSQDKTPTASSLAGDLLDIMEEASANVPEAGPGKLPVIYLSLLSLIWIPLLVSRSIIYLTTFEKRPNHFTSTPIPSPPPNSLPPSTQFLFSSPFGSSNFVRSNSRSVREVRFRSFETRSFEPVLESRVLYYDGENQT